MDRTNQTFPQQGRKKSKISQVFRKSRATQANQMKKGNVAARDQIHKTKERTVLLKYHYL